MDNSFLMVTPAKNEELYLPKVIESVANSSLIPRLWVIFDDGSTDNTLNIAKEAARKHKFIVVIDSGINPSACNRDLRFHYSYICNKAFNYAIDYAGRNAINWSYIALLDADTVIEKSYFEDIINKMASNPKIGIASGEISILMNGKIKKVKVFSDIPSGTARIWNKKCFDETGGYILTQAPDTVSMIKAKAKGWMTVRFKQVYAYELRETSSAEGLYKGYINRGTAAYYLNNPPLLVLMRGISYIITQPKCYVFLPYIGSYIFSYLKGDPKLQDEDVINYYKTKRIQELLEYIKFI